MVKQITIYQSPNTRRWTYGSNGIFNNVPADLCAFIAGYSTALVKTFPSWIAAMDYAEVRGYWCQDDQ